MTLSCYLPLFHLIHNSLTGQISQELLGASINIKLISSFRLFRVYYEALPSDSPMRLRLLREIEKYMNCTVGNRLFLMRSEGFLTVVWREVRRLWDKRDMSKNVNSKKIKRYR